MTSQEAGFRDEIGGEVEHRGEVAVRGSIVDVFPSTAVGSVFPSCVRRDVR